MSDVPETKDSIEILEFLQTCSERERHIFCLGMTYCGNLYEMCNNASLSQIQKISEIINTK